MDHGKARQQEGELWLSFTKGDERALSELIRQWSRPMAFYGRKLVRDDNLIQDCIQETFIELWKYRSNLRRTTEIRPYLFTCLRRKVITAVRRQLLFVQTDTELHDWFEADFSIEDALIESETEAEQIRILNTFLNNLPKRQKEAIYLRFYENMTNQEIAEVMGVKYQTATNLLHEALVSLREAIPSRITLMLLLQLWAA